MSEHAPVEVEGHGRHELAYPPRMTAFTQPFWDALDQGRLTTTRCRACQRISFPPKFLCPSCWGTDLEWIELSGRGAVRSYTEVLVAPSMFAAEVPYVLAVIDLDEGVRCLSRLVDPYDSLVPDMRVRVQFREATPVSLFEFTRDDGEVRL